MDPGRQGTGQWQNDKQAEREGTGGETVAIDAQIEEEARWEPQDIPLDIVYEDADILVINKPRGLVVHPGAGNPDGTVLNALLHYFPEIADVPRAGIVHRLDKDTTGLMVVAKTVPAQTRLVEALQEREITREYEAVAIGTMTAGGTVEQPIARHSTKRTHMAVHPMGKPAVTHYRIMEHFRAHTRLRLRLETGRTHQIRVHMAYIDHPLVGDQLYGGRPRPPKGASEAFINTLRGFDRQALHATMLRLYHPISGIQMEWHAPIPQDMIDSDQRAEARYRRIRRIRWIGNEFADCTRLAAACRGNSLQLHSSWRCQPSPYDSLNLGEHVGDDAQAVARNRQCLVTAAGLPQMPLWLEQVHGTRVMTLDGQTPEDLRADAVYSNVAGLVCAVMTADCLPVLFASQAGDEVAAAHAGWRGLCHGVLENTVARFAAAPENITAWLGPAIGRNRFEVGAEVRAAFMDIDSAAAAAFTPHGEKFLADLYLLARQRLQRAGIFTIYGGNRCTMNEMSHFFSYRRDGTTGRMASLIWVR